MSKSGGDFGPINALGIGIMLALLPALLGGGILAYKVGQVIDREIVQQLLNICGVATVATVTIIGLIFVLMVERRRSIRDYPAASSAVPGNQWDVIPPHYMTGPPLNGLPQAPTIDVSPENRGTVHTTGVDRQLADSFKEEW